MRSTADAYGSGTSFPRSLIAGSRTVRDWIMFGGLPKPPSPTSTDHAGCASAGSAFLQLAHCMILARKLPAF